MKKLDIKWQELDMAFDTSSFETSAYLDTETGDVLYVSDDERRYLEKIYEEHFDPDAPEEFDIDEALAQVELPDWEKEAVKTADFVEQHFGKRVIGIPQRPPYEAYNEMQDFIATIEDDRLYNQLNNATHGRGAFGRFKDILYHHPAEQQRWYAFQENQQRERIMEWLAEKGIEILE